MSTRKLLLLPHAQDIHLLQGSPLHGVLMFFLRTEGAVRAATTAARKQMTKTPKFQTAQVLCLTSSYFLCFETLW